MLPLSMRRIAYNAFLLLGSGLLSALAFALLSSGRWQIMNSATIAFFLLFIQWQLLAVSVAKLGADQVAYVIARKDPKKCVDAEAFLIRKALPLLLFFSIGLLFIFSNYLAIVVIFLSASADIWSLLLAADQNARRRFSATAFSNLLNYPLFFLIIILLRPFVDIHQDVVLLVFLSTSILRLIWLRWHAKKNIAPQKVVTAIDLEMGGQQVLNFAVYKLDQLIVGSTVLRSNLSGLQERFVNQFLFMSKFPELVCAVIVALGVMFLPAISVRSEIEARQLLCNRRTVMSIVIYMCSLMLAVSVYVSLGSETMDLKLSFIAPFFLASVLALPVYVLSYAMLQEGYVSHLLLCLLLALVAGLTIFLILRLWDEQAAIIWLVPAQLAFAVFSGIYFRWRSPKALYR